jgi:MFS family permease
VSGRWRAPAGVSAEQWVLIFALPLGQVGNIALFTVLGEVRDDFALSYAELGAIISVFAVVRLVMGVPSGLLLHWFNPRTVLIGALLANLGSSALALLAGSAWQLGVARGLHGGSSAVLQAVVLGWLVGGASSAVRGRVMALSEAGFGVMSFAAPIVVGALAESVGWRAAFWGGVLMAALAVATVALWTNAASGAAAMGQGAGRAGDARVVSLGAALRAGGAVLLAAYLLAFLVFFARQAVLSTILPLLAADRVGLSPLQIGLGQSLMNVLSIPVLIAGGWWGDRVGRRAVLAPGVLLLLLTQFAVLLVADPTSYYVVSAVASVGYAVNSFPTSLVGDALPGPARAQGIVGYRMIADVALLTAPVVVGVLLEVVGFDATRVAVLVPTVAVLAAIVLLIPESRGWGLGARRWGRR